jgi:hypothetical protein
VRARSSDESAGLETARQRPFQRFFQTESAGGALLLLCGVAAIGIANSPWADPYNRFWNTPLAIEVGSHVLSLTLHGWINDGLMAVFFLLVGLEITVRSQVITSTFGMSVTTISTSSPGSDSKNGTIPASSSTARRSPHPTSRSPSDRKMCITAQTRTGKSGRIV